MSRARLSLGGRSSINLPNDSSIIYHNISQDNSILHGRKLSYDGFRQDSRDDGLSHGRKRQQSYFGDSSNIPTRPTEYQRSSVTTEALVNENSELKNQRDQYLAQLNKNEEMLWKAREVISHLKSDIHLENLSKNLINQANFSQGSLKIDENEINLKKSEQKVKDLTKKLQSKEAQIQELNQVISKLNVDNHGLQSKLTKAIAKIKELKTISETSTRTDASYNDITQRQSAKGDLQKKLDTTIQYNFDLFGNYTKIMKENSELQARVFALEQELGRFRGDSIIDKHTAHSIIKETEYKIEHIEQNISKIEETSFILPQLEQRFEAMQKTQKEKFKLIKCAVQLLQEEVGKTLNCLGKNERQILSDLDTSQNILNSVTLRGETRRLTFPLLLESIRNEEVREIVEQLQPDRLIKPLIQKVVKTIYAVFMEKFNYKTTRNLATLEQKIKNLEGLRVPRKSAVHNPFYPRSKSTNVNPRRQQSTPGYSNFNEGNKENSFLNILNTSNSRF